MRISKQTKVRLVVIALIVALIYAVSGVTFALWNNDSQLSESVQNESYASFGVAKDNGALTDADYQWFENAGDTTAVTFSEVEAQSAATAGAVGIATPIYVNMRTEGNNGLSYSAQINAFSASPPNNTFFEAATVRLFQVTSAADCTVANAPATQSTMPLEVSSILPSDTSKQKIDIWCVTIVDSGTSAPRVNTGHVEGTGAAQQVEDDDTFTAYVVEDLIISFQHTLTRPQ